MPSYFYNQLLLTSSSFWWFTIKTDCSRENVNQVCVYFSLCNGLIKKTIKWYQWLEPSGRGSIWFWSNIADVAHRKHPLLFHCKFKLRMLFNHPAGKMWVNICILQGICIGSMPNFPSVFIFIIIFKTWNGSLSYHSKKSLTDWF